MFTRRTQPVKPSPSEDDEIEVDDRPVTRLANTLLRVLVESGADELHIAPEGKDGEVRAELVGPDGRRPLPLKEATRGEIHSLPRRLWPALAARYVEMTLQSRLHRPATRGFVVRWGEHLADVMARFEPGGGLSGGEAMLVKIVEKKSTRRG